MIVQSFDRIVSLCKQRLGLLENDDSQSVMEPPPYSWVLAAAKVSIVDQQLVVAIELPDFDEARSKISVDENHLSLELYRNNATSADQCLRRTVPLAHPVIANEYVADHANATLSIVLQRNAARKAA